MSYVAENVKEKFESLPIDLKNYILEKNISINNMNDLMTILKNIVNENKNQS